MHGFDTIVVGSGVIGSATAYYLARHGRRALILDQQDKIPNPIGSSADHAYLFRLTHGRDSFATDLSVRTLPLWRQLEHETGEELLQQTGMLELATGSGCYEEASLKALTELKIPVHRWEPAEVCERYRVLRRAAFKFGVFHPDGGLVWAQRAIGLFTRLAMKRGSRAAHGVKIVRILRDKTGVQGLKDSSGKVWKAQDYVFAAGPWTRELLAGYGLPLRVTRQHTLYFRPPRNQGRYRPDHFPVFAAAGRGFYGFPVHIHGFMKVGREREGPPCKRVEAVDMREPVFQKNCRAFLKDFVPDLAGFHEVEDRVCHTTRTPDGDFILDHLPDAANAHLAVGFSGKSPMLAPLIGRTLAGLVLKEKSEINLHRFQFDRFKMRRSR
ncbi:MAG: FAD-dependent oxidoreductase [Elusimicrobia bacterium]|nr:FAD-dependent oxidoreductase [Elusimicrobiota bacterium]